jgi:hypothetical protein
MRAPLVTKTITRDQLSSQLISYSLSGRYRRRIQPIDATHCR